MGDVVMGVWNLLVFKKRCTRSLYWTLLTRITFNKIPCYMCGSGCRWLIVKNAKHFTLSKNAKLC